MNRVLGLLGHRRAALLAVAAVILVGAGLIVRVVLLPASGAAASSTVLTVIGGSVQVQAEGDSALRPAVDGEALHAGDRVVTGADGRAVITFFEGSTQTLEPSTEITITRLESTGSGRLLAGIRQVAGVTWNTVVNTSDDPAQYEIETAAATAAVRDTMFLVQVHEDGSTTVVTRQGSVAVTAGGIEVIVGEGESVTVKPGEPPPPVQEQTALNQLSIELASSAWLLVVAPDGFAAGLAPGGVPVNQIPLAVISEPADEPQTIELAQLESGDYALHFTGKESGPFHLTIIGAAGERVTCLVEQEGTATPGAKIKAVLTLEIVDGLLVGCRLSEIASTEDASSARYIEQDALVDAIAEGRTLWPEVEVLGDVVTPAPTGDTQPDDGASATASGDSPATSTTAPAITPTPGVAATPTTGGPAAATPTSAPVASATSLPPPPPAGCGGEAVFRSAVVEDAAFANEYTRFANEYRTSRGAAAFVNDPILYAAAREYAKLLAEHQWWENTIASGISIHVGPDCRNFTDRVVAHGWPHAHSMGENVAWGDVGLTPSASWNILLNSEHEPPTHPYFGDNPHMGTACFKQTSGSPPQFACAQVYAAAP